MQTNYPDIPSNWKRYNNLLLARRVKEFGEMDLSVHLDAPSFGSTRTMLEIMPDLKAEQLLIPQNDDKHYQQMYNADFAVVSRQSMWELLNDLASTGMLQRLNVFNGDYCATVEGSDATCHPLDDIMFWLQEGRPQKAIFCGTFCVRDRRGKFDDRKCMLDQGYLDFLLPCFTYNSYKVSNVVMYTYPGQHGRPMLFYLMQIDRDPDMDTTAEFPVDIFDGYIRTLGYANYFPLEPIQRPKKRKKIILELDEPTF